MSLPVLAVEGLTTMIGRGDRAVAAVSDVSFSVSRGQALCLLGESGSGKSVTALSLMGLLGAGACVTGGSIRLDGRELRGLGERAWRQVRGRQMAMIFQDPVSALNPLLRIGAQLVESLRAHDRTVSRVAAWAHCAAMLAQVGIADPAAGMQAWPHAFSGGMLQRVTIAMAMLHRPRIIIADEPTTALDATVQYQILQLVARLAREQGTALLWITHDLGVARAIADEVAVLRQGRIVETGPARAVFGTPRHAYTRQLVALDARLRQAEEIAA